MSQSAYSNKRGQTWFVTQAGWQELRELVVNQIKMVMFAFEFAVLTVLSLSTTARYALSLYETALMKQQIAHGRERLRQRTENQLSEEEINTMEIDAAGWEEKGLWTFYLDIATDFLKLVLYLSFFCVLCMFYGMPIHIIRDVALTIRSFYKRIRDFAQYKHATRNMNARYPDATAEEISREDVCIICRENMTAWQDAAEATPVEHQSIDERQRAKKLPCGHLLHLACLRSWLERQQICPTCRTPVLNDTSEVSNLHQGTGPVGQGRPRVTNPPAGGPRVYTFGPFRLVFGARHINQNLPPIPPPPGAVGGPTDAIMNRNTTPISSVGVQAQLNQIEQHIAREISNLNTLSDQLQLVRALQSELARLRVSQGLPGHLAPGLNFQQRQMSHLQPQQALQAYRQIPLTPEMPAFPAGLTIPENWTLHSLQRIPGRVNVGTQPSPGDGGRFQQAQSADTHPQGSDSAMSQRRSSSTAQESQSQNPEGLIVSQAPQASILAQHHAWGDESARALNNENSIGLPEWGSHDGQDKEKDEQQAGESSTIGSIQDKGKGKAVTVEEDVDNEGAIT
ncbi:MAG: hypothetical protein Q9216_002700 [Gyalolechia sp. 2 TL-2023]